MLLCSVSAWIVFTLAIGFVQPPATSCVVFNGTHHILKEAYATVSVFLSLVSVTRASYSFVLLLMCMFLVIFFHCFDILNIVLTYSGDSGIYVLFP